MPKNPYIPSTLRNVGRSNTEETISSIKQGHSMAVSRHYCQTAGLIISTQSSVDETDPTPRIASICNTLTYQESFSITGTQSFRHRKVIMALQKNMITSSILIHI